MPFDPMLYVYAIAESVPPPSGKGLRGAPLLAIDGEGLFAVASEHDDLRIEASEDDLWAHENVVEVLMERGPVLPMRLASTLADADAVRRMLRERQDEFEGALARVRGAVELGVRAAIEPEDSSGSTEPERDGAGPGTAYLMGRLENDRRGADAAARIHEPLATLARESTQRLGARGRPLLTASYLVDHERVDSFKARVEELDAALPTATIVCTGPWPPYSFASTGAGR
jgi:hypothetical protein